MQRATEPIADALHLCVGCRDIERTAPAYRHPPCIPARILPCRYDCAHDVSRLEALDAPGSFGTSARKAPLVHATHLPRAMAHGCDEQGRDSLDTELLRCALAHARGIRPVRLGKAELHAVVLGQPSTAALDRQSERLEPLVEHPARGVHGGSVPKWGFRLGENAGKTDGVALEEHADILHPLFPVARLTGETYVADAICAAPGTTHKVFDLQGHVFGIAVSTPAPPLFQEVLAYLISCQFALLILDACYLGMVHELRIELDQLHADLGDRAHAHQPPCPGERRGHPALKRRRKPALWPPSVVEPGRTVARFALPSPAANSPPSMQGVLDLLPAMREFRGENHLAILIVDEGEASRLGARVEFQAEWPRDFLSHLLLEDEREGIAAKHRRLPGVEQLACPPGMYRVQWLFVRIHKKDFPQHLLLCS